MTNETRTTKPELFYRHYGFGLDHSFLPLLSDVKDQVPNAVASSTQNKSSLSSTFLAFVIPLAFLISSRPAHPRNLRQGKNVPRNFTARLVSNLIDTECIGYIKPARFG